MAIRVLDAGALIHVHVLYGLLRRLQLWEMLAGHVDVDCTLDLLRSRKLLDLC